MQNKIEVIEFDRWVARVRVPEGDGPHPLLLLLHGWTGDEDVMWVFTQRLPKTYLMVAPRGIHTTPLGGYGWHPHRTEGWPDLEEFQPAVEALHEFIPQLINEASLPLKTNGEESIPVNMVGFSQGAALAYSYVLAHPNKVERLAGLAGFLPLGAESLIAEKPLQGKRLFVAHGTQDQMVPIERARQAVELLEQAGAQVIYCEDDVGHKLSLTCFQGFEQYFR